MASTITLQTTINFSLPLLRYQPLTIGTANEPAITSANVVAQTILGPPFVWQWNRNTNATQSTTAGTQDYPIAITDYGFFEKATVTDPTGNVTELVWKEVLSAETAGSLNRARPTFISTQLDDNAGNITFRLMPVPDQVYALTIIYQKVPILFTALSQTWAPIPDKMEYVYTRGFLSFAFQLSDDQRFMVEHQRFLASLLANAEGLSESARNLFLGNALNTSAQMQNAQLRTQQGAQARGT